MARFLQFFGLCLCLLLAVPSARADEAEARRLLAEAEAASWLALNNAGDLAVFDWGLDILAEAEAAIEALPAGAARESLRLAAAALHADLLWQREVHHDKLPAAFPLIRFYNTTLLLDRNAFGSLELADDPRERAAEQALGRLLAINIAGPLRPQIHVVVGAWPEDPELESLALNVLKDYPGFALHNRREVAAALAPLDPDGSLAQALFEGRLPPDWREAVFTRLADVFGGNRLLYVTLLAQPAPEGVSFFHARGDLFNRDALDTTTDPLRFLGLGVDRNHLVAPLALAHLLFFGLAVLLHQRLRGGRFEGEDLVAPAIGFLLGRMLPWLVLPLLAGLQPDPDTRMTLGFWWPAVAGAAVVLAPLLLLVTAGRRIALLAPYLAWERGLESLALGVACGVAAWLAVPLLVLRDLAGGLPLLLLALPGLFGVAWLSARLMKGELWLWYAPLLALLWGLCLATALPAWVLAGSALVLAGLLPLVMTGRRAAARPDAPATLPSAGYRPFAVLERLRTAAQPLQEGRVAWVALTGPAASGKSSHARALLAELTAREGLPLLLLDGTCERLPDGGEVPFGPFQHCLAHHLKLDVQRLSGGGEGGGEGLYDLLLGPLAPLFSGSAGLSASERDLYHFVTRALKQQAGSLRVVLLVEDAQWLDEASAGLLRHLQEAMPPGTQGGLLVLLVGRAEEPDARLAALLPACERIALGPLAPAEQEDLLRQGCGLSSEAADWVIEWLGGRRGQAVLAGQLAEVVEQLRRAQALVEGPEGLAFAPGFDRRHPPLAASAVAEVRAVTARLPQTLDTLSIAAALGRRFEASLVAEALGQGRKTVLKDLDLLERESGLVRDVLEEDDVFEFRSQRALDAVREALGIRLEGPRATTVSQAVREVHAQIAQALAARAGQRQEADALAELLAQATHWYGAGRSHAAAAVPANLLAMRRLAALQRFGEAEAFLEQAADCALFLRDETEVAAGRLWLAAERAHVTGRGARAAAEAGLAYLAEQGAAGDEPVLAIARACYEAGRDGGLSLAGEAERLGLRVAGGAGAPLERAQGLHLAGLALRFDPARAAEGRLRLAEALALAEAQGPAGEPLVAQIANSLGLMEQAKGPGGAAAAEALFRRSLELKQRQAIADRPGLARSYGGLGLLILEGGERARLQEAEDYLTRDLELAEELQDLNGLSKVRLWLGRCHFLQGESRAARKSFEAARALGFSPADVVSAEAGLLRVALAERDPQGALALAEGLAARFAEAAPPRESREALEAALAEALAWDEIAGDDSLRRLRERLAA